MVRPERRTALRRAIEDLHRYRATFGQERFLADLGQLEAFEAWLLARGA